ncbi:MAG: hypothetical protein WCR54_06910 [Clostridia bacterium]
MIKVNNITIPVGFDQNQVLKSKLIKELGNAKIIHFDVIKKSIDARDKSDIKYVYNVAVELENESLLLKKGFDKFDNSCNDLEQTFGKLKYPSDKASPIIVGSGPSGLFLALALALSGAKPIIFERGKDVVGRQEVINKFNKFGILDTNCNVQFGEGGAGTFSDGKLNSGINNEYVKMVLREFVNCGAPNEIEYLAKPHMGTDNLVNVVVNIRKKIEDLGGKVYFDSLVSDVIMTKDKISGVVVNGNKYMSDTVIFAIGHSARDTYYMLNNCGLEMTQKGFSLGVRIEHLQSDLNMAQYGKMGSKLPSADYKLAVHLKERSLYTFCMCPGGKVINASSEKGQICINGMSKFGRDEINGNSALLVGINPEDFGSDSPLAGIELQRRYERKAFEISNSYRPPCQLLGDFMQDKVSTNLGKVNPSVSGGFVFGNLNDCLPSFVASTIKNGVPIMARRLRGFDMYDSVLTGIEARSSSPVRITRDSNYNTSISGLYAVGEGSGYAGGITSSAVDGIKCGLALLNSII